MATEKHAVVLDQCSTVIVETVQSIRQHAFRIEEIAVAADRYTLEHKNSLYSRDIEKIVLAFREELHKLVSLACAANNRCRDVYINTQWVALPVDPTLDPKVYLDDGGPNADIKVNRGPDGSILL